DGDLHFISDRTGWWNLYCERHGAVVPLTNMNAEFGGPQWIFDLSRYAFLSDGRIACTYSSNGLDYVGILHSGSLKFERLDIPYDTITDLRSDGDRQLYCVVASGLTAPQVVQCEVSSRSVRVLRNSLQVDLQSGDISVAQPIEFPTEGGRQ